MTLKLSDALLVLTLVSIPLLGVLQACGDGSPSTPEPNNGHTPPANNHAPVAVISVDGPTEGPTPFTVSLNASESFDPDGDDLLFWWTLADGEGSGDPIVDLEITSSGRHEVRLIVTDEWGLADDAGPMSFLGYGLANSAWPKFAHDERNSGVSPNAGPMMDLANADSGRAFPRYWRSGIENGRVTSVCVGYDGIVIYTQGSWLRARTAEGGILWDIEVDSAITAWPAIAYDGTILFGSHDGMVHRVNSIGEIIWNTDLTADYGTPMVLNCAVNIDGIPQVYICGVTQVGQEAYPFICALSLEGEILWRRSPTQYNPEHTLCVMAPAIAQNGNIVVNGYQGMMFTPDGDLVTSIDYDLEDQENHVDRHPLGPPTIGPDGQIIFSHIRAPTFSREGAYLFELLGSSVNMWYDRIYATGFSQAPVWAPDSVTLVLHKDSSDDEGHEGFYLSTRSDYGGLARVYVSDEDDVENHDYSYNESDYIGGAVTDCLGRTYVSALGIHAVSPISAASVFPFVTRRYSLWSYCRPSNRMSPPVIGENGWLYVGYGNDIMAIGD